MDNRERLGSRLGFILLSAGCAIGCGNVWKFPWILYPLNTRDPGPQPCCPQIQETKPPALTLPLCSRMSRCLYAWSISAAAYAAQRKPRAANRCRSLGTGWG